MNKNQVLILLLLPGVVLAQESGEAPIASWKGEGELGYTTTSGNTESESLIARLGISKTHNKWTHSASLEALKASTDNVSSADSMVLKEKSQYSLGEKAYAFGQLRYEDDKFSGFDYKASLTFGFGSRFIESEAHTLDGSIGAGYRSSKDALTRETQDEAIASLDALYEYRISETASLSEKISVESGEDNTYSESETALKARINGNLSSKISYLVKHNSDVPAGIEKTDKILAVSLVYSF